MNFKHLAAAGLSPLQRMIGKSTKPTIRIFIFHDIRPQDQVRFGHFIQWLSGVAHILSPDEAGRWLSNSVIPDNTERPACLLTFDDGFASNFHVAESILAKTGVRAVFFVCPGIVGASQVEQSELISKNIFRSNKGHGSSGMSIRMMNWDELRRLRDTGHAIGNHGMYHQRLSSLDPIACEREIVDGAYFLSQEMGEESQWFAHAFGDIDSITEHALATASRHHEFCRSGIRGENSANTGSRILFADQVDIIGPKGYWRFLLDGGFDLKYRAARARIFEMRQLGA